MGRIRVTSGFEYGDVNDPFAEERRSMFKFLDTEFREGQTLAIGLNARYLHANGIPMDSKLEVVRLRAVTQEDEMNRLRARLPQTSAATLGRSAVVLAAKFRSAVSMGDGARWNLSLVLPDSEDGNAAIPVLDAFSTNKPADLAASVEDISMLPGYRYDYRAIGFAAEEYAAGRVGAQIDEHDEITVS